MKNHLKVVSIFVMFFILAGCVFLPEKYSLAPTIQVSTLTSTVKSTATFTPQPTSTNTPIPTATPPLWNTKTVLAQFGIFGGDGGWDYSAFIGGDAPKWVLYTDGQLVIQKEDDNGIWFEETTLTVAQMCSFLSQVDKVGFFSLPVNDSFIPAYPTDYPNPIYKFDSTTQFSEGAPNFILQVNGLKHRQIYVYIHYVQYLVPSARQVFNFFSNFSSTPTLSEFQAEYMLLRIEEGLGKSVYSTPTPTTLTWSNDLPPLYELEGENIETAATPYLSRKKGKISQALITGEMIKPIFEEFDNRLKYQLFQSGDQVFYVAARPLLPHETLNSFSDFPQEKEFELPFSCSN